MADCPCQLVDPIRRVPAIGPTDARFSLMERPTQLEGVRYVGDKRRQRVYDLEMLDREDVAEAVGSLVDAEQFATFGPDTLDEARNRGYRPFRTVPTAPDE